MSISSLVTLSTGEKIANPKTFKAKHKRLRKAQKALAQKLKSSSTGRLKNTLGRLQLAGQGLGTDLSLAETTD